MDRTNINIEIAGHMFERVRVTAVERSHILVGRDSLNQLKIFLDGKNLQFEIIE